MDCEGHVRLANDAQKSKPTFRAEYFARIARLTYGNVSEICYSFLYCPHDFVLPSIEKHSEACAHPAISISV